MLLARHMFRVLSGLVLHAVRTRSLGVLALAVAGGTVVAVTLVAQVVGPIAIYPFL